MELYYSLENSSDQLSSYEREVLSSGEESSSLLKAEQIERKESPRPLPEPKENTPLSQVTLFTIGYLAPYAEENLHALVTWRSLIVDIRYNPTSRLPQWRQAALRRRFGERYRHIKALGNATYKTKGLITLARPEEGLAQVVNLLTSGQSVTLLCACRDPEHCHRALVASLIGERLPEVPIRHLPGPLEMPERIVWTQAREETPHGANND